MNSKILDSWIWSFKSFFFSQLAMFVKVLWIPHDFYFELLILKQIFTMPPIPTLKCPSTSYTPLS